MERTIIRYDYFDTPYPIYLAASLVGFVGGSVSQAGEVAKELHSRRNCFSVSSMERIFMSFGFIETIPDLKRVPDSYRKSKESEELTKRLKGIRLPFKFNPSAQRG